MPTLISTGSDLAQITSTSISRTLNTSCDCVQEVSIIGSCLFWMSCTQYMKDWTFFWIAIPNLLVWRFYCLVCISIRAWASPGWNNNMYYMVTSWWDSINRVTPAVEMPATLRHSCRVYSGTGGMSAVTVAAMFLFGLGGCCSYFFWFVLFLSGSLVFLFLVSSCPISLVFILLVFCSFISLVFVFLVF